MSLQDADPALPEEPEDEALQVTEDDLLEQIDDNSPAARHARRKLRAAKAQAEASVAEAQLAVKDALALLLDSPLCANMYPSLVSLNQAIRVLRIALLQVLEGRYDVAQSQATADAVLFLAEQDASKSPTGALDLRFKVKKQTLVLLRALGRAAREYDPDPEGDEVFSADSVRYYNRSLGAAGASAGEGGSERADPAGNPDAGEQPAAAAE